MPLIIDLDKYDGKTTDRFYQDQKIWLSKQTNIDGRAVTVYYSKNIQKKIDQHLPEISQRLHGKEVSRIVICSTSKFSELSGDYQNTLVEKYRTDPNINLKDSLDDTKVGVFGRKKTTEFKTPGAPNKRKDLEKEQKKKQREKEKEKEKVDTEADEELEDSEWDDSEYEDPPTTDIRTKTPKQESTVDGLADAPPGGVTGFSENIFLQPGIENMSQQQTTTPIGYVGGSDGTDLVDPPINVSGKPPKAPAPVEFKFKSKYPNDMVRFQKYLDVKPMEEQFFPMYHRYSDFARFNKFFFETSI